MAAASGDLFGAAGGDAGCGPAAVEFAFASIGSGSRGNGTLVQGPDGCLLIDCGFSLRVAEERLARLGVAAATLRGILVTHEHSDHISGVARLARAHGLTVYATPGTARQLVSDGYELVVISARQSLPLAGLQVQPVVVPHDARDPVQFVFSNGRARLGVLTDAGHFTPHMIDAYHDVDALMLECNHDADMLWHGRYPEPLKRRVGGPRGHLSNAQAVGFLRAVGGPRLRHLALAHLSEQNNLPAAAEQCIRTALEDLLGVSPEVLLADQQHGLAWTPVTARAS